MHAYRVCPRKEKLGFDLISDALPYGGCGTASHAINNAIDHAKFRSRSHRAVIHVYDDPGNVIETLEYKSDFNKP